MLRLASRATIVAARVAPPLRLMDMMIEFLMKPVRLLGSSLALTVCVALAGASLAASPGESPWVGETFSKVRLVSGSVAGMSDGQMIAGVQIRLEPGWKTYWRMPGDFGVPPTFDWSGSKNLRSAEVLYPAPHRFTDASGTAIGYEDEVVFPVMVTPERLGRAGRAQAQCRLRSVQDAVHPEPGEPQHRASGARGREGGRSLAQPFRRPRAEACRDGQAAGPWRHRGQARQHQARAYHRREFR